MPQFISSSPLDRILELKDEVEMQKVELTPEVKAYIQSHLKGVQAKLDRGEDVTEEDMEFIDVVRHKIEALKRHITPQQWIDLLHVALASGKSKDWIDQQFQFPGGNQISSGNLMLGGFSSLTHLPENLQITGHLDLARCSSLTSLPENLSVRTDIFLNDCPSLTHLPQRLEVGADFYLENCVSLSYLPEYLEVEGFLDLENCSSLVELPQHLKVGGGLNLRGCKSLTHLPHDFVLDQEDLSLAHCVSLRQLPEHLKVKRTLVLEGCTSLMYLPENLEVGRDLILSSDLQFKVKEDARELLSKGKIKGIIEYR